MDDDRELMRDLVEIWVVTTLFQLLLFCGAYLIGYFFTGFSS
jgi:hypothetical protein